MIAPKYNIRSPSTNLSAHEIKHHNMWKHFVDTLTDSVKIIFLQVLVVFNCFVYIFTWCFFQLVLVLYYAVSHLATIKDLCISD